MKNLTLSNAGILVGAVAVAYWFISKAKSNAPIGKTPQYFGGYADSAVPDFLAPDDWVSGINQPRLLYA